MIHDTIKQRLRASVLLVPPSKAALASALRCAADLRADGTWDDLPDPMSMLPGSANPVHLERTLLLAKAHRPAAGALDDPLRRTLDHWLSRDFAGPDWRTNEIVIPRLIGEIALLYDNEISAGAAGKVLEILARARWADWVVPAGWVDLTGLDLLGVAYNQLLRGCLENAPSVFEAAFARVFRTICPVAADAEGMQADMTFQARTGAGAGGGFAFGRECAKFIALAHGTTWQAPADTVKLFAGFLLDGQQWMMRQGTVDAQTPDDVYSEANDLAGTAAAVQQLAQLGNPPRRLELAAFARRLQGCEEALSGHRYFWRARMSVHQRPAFYASLRLAASPCGDGQTFILRTGREYFGVTSTAAKAMSAGTTTFRGAKDASLENLLPAFDDARWLSGGVSEGDCGMGATELSRPGLQGRKVWFFFDESLVCLGTGLRSTLANDPVCTTVNHCRLQGPVVIRSANGDCRVLSPHQEHTASSVRAVEHDGISYFFPEPVSVTVQSGGLAAVETADPAAASADFRLQIEHGPHPQGGSWAYFVLPSADDLEVAARTLDEIGRIEILANTPALQAVRHLDLGLLGVAFWEPGVVLLPDGGRVAANHVCLLLCREISGGGTRLSISNPTADAATVHVEYGGQCVCFELPGGVDAGRSMSRLL